jgi:hypothetical protein
MSLQPIPDPWLRTVCVLLRGDPAKVIFTKEGYRRWSREFPSAYRFHLEAAFLALLRTGTVYGCPVTLSFPPGTTWEFFFQFQNEKLYGKILLTPDHQRLLILSAHRPERPTLQCE